MDYTISYLKSYENGSLFAKLESARFGFEVDAELHLEDGEDPLVKAEITMWDKKRPYDASGSVYVYPDNGKITSKSIYEAVQEFLSGGGL